MTSPCVASFLQSPNGWHAAQALVSAYASVAPPSGVIYRKPPSASSAGVPQPEDTPRHSPTASKQRLWRIVFHTRDSDIRQFSNLRALLEDCSRWSWVQQKQTGGDGAVVHRALCSTHTFTDVLSSIAGEQVHGLASRAHV